MVNKEGQKFTTIYGEELEYQLTKPNDHTYFFTWSNSGWAVITVIIEAQMVICSSFYGDYSCHFPSKEKDLTLRKFKEFLTKLSFNEVQKKFIFEKNLMNSFDKREWKSKITAYLGCGYFSKETFERLESLSDYPYDTLLLELKNNFYDYSIDPSLSLTKLLPELKLSVGASIKKIQVK